MFSVLPRILRWLALTVWNLALAAMGAALLGAVAAGLIALAFYLQGVWGHVAARLMFMGVLGVLLATPVLLTYFIVRHSFRIFAHGRDQLTAARKRRLLFMIGAFAVSYVVVVMVADTALNVYGGLNSTSTDPDLRTAILLVLDSMMKGAMMDLAESFNWNIIQYSPNNLIGGALNFHMRAMSSVVLVNILKVSWDEAGAPLFARRRSGS